MALPTRLSSVLHPSKLYLDAVLTKPKLLYQYFQTLLFKMWPPSTAECLHCCGINSTSTSRRRPVLIDPEQTKNFLLTNGKKYHRQIQSSPTGILMRFWLFDPSEFCTSINHICLLCVMLPSPSMDQGEVYPLMVDNYLCKFMQPCYVHSKDIAPLNSVCGWQKLFRCKILTLVVGKKGNKSCSFLQEEIMSA